MAVGAGYTGAEFVAQMQYWVHTIAQRWDSYGPDETRWLLIDLAPHILPELGPRLGQEATRLLSRRGIEIRLGVTLASATATSVTLTDGSTVPTQGPRHDEGQDDRHHAASVAEPPPRHRPRHAHRVGGVTDTLTIADQRPEPTLNINRERGTAHPEHLTSDWVLPAVEHGAKSC